MRVHVGSCWRFVPDQWAQETRVTPGSSLVIRGSWERLTSWARLTEAGCLNVVLSFWLIDYCREEARRVLETSCTP